MVTQNAEKMVEPEKLQTRPPIVVVLGHVDHGKSSLLEAIREDFRITEKESGGITQHMGAYQAEYEEKKITFLDTPGHELFSAMRARGAKVADVAVLVVAADEGVKPQTIEAIGQIKKAGIPTIVAINKMDRPGANVQKIKQELAQHEIMVESYGGSVPSVETSATTKQGIKELLEMILLVAEVEDLQTNESGVGEGVVIESSMDAKRGPTATILVQSGQVQKGDFIATPTTGGKIRILEDFQGNAQEQAVASMPIVVLGFFKSPRVGETFHIFEEEEAMNAAIQEKKPEEKAHIVALDPAARVVNIILKADVEGSLEALEEVLRGIPQEHTSLRIVDSGVGEVTENDVRLAQSAKAPVFAFRTKVNPAALSLAEREEVVVKTFGIIYELVQAVRELLKEAEEEPEEGRKEIGSLLVLAVFATERKKQIIGGKVIEGEARKGVRAEIVREAHIVGEGKIQNVQREKRNVSSVSSGKECGLSFEGEEKIQAGDELRFFIL